MMTLKRFRLLSESYGAELSRWPAEVRGQAQDFLGASAQARALLDEARQLDESIAAASAHEHARHWPPGEESRALARLRSRVALRIAAEPVRRPFGWVLAGARLDGYARLRLWGLATGGVFAIVAGLTIGTLYAPAPSQAGVLTALLQPAALEFLSE